MTTPQVLIVRDHVLSGRAFSSIEEMDAAFTAWVPRQRAQIHKTHREVIGHRAARDHAALKTLPPAPYLVAERHLRPVGKDCLIAFGGNPYSVPARKVRPRQLVEIRATKSQVMLHSTVPDSSGETLPAMHPRAVGRGVRVVGKARRRRRRGRRVPLRGAGCWWSETPEGSTCPRWANPAITFNVSLMKNNFLSPLAGGLSALTAAVVISVTSVAGVASAGGTFLGRLHTVREVASTVPANGDVNPYGTAVVVRDAGKLRRGNVLVSNFNNSQNQQGTGTTLVQVGPRGTAKLFARIDPARLPGPCPGGVGLTTALSILPGGWVVVGSLPTADGTSDTAQAGCLLVLDSHGRVRETLAGGGINGPWDMTATSHGDRTDLFVTNVLNDTVAGGGNEVDQGTVLRITLKRHGHQPPRWVRTTTIGSGFAQKTDPAALVIGPTGVGLAKDGSLYVADTVNNRITVIPRALSRDRSAGTGRVVSSDGRLNGPLGLAIAPNGHILTVNSGDGNIVETTRAGRQVAFRQLDNSGSPPGAGALFGLAVDLDRDAVYFVNDATNFLNVLR
ncbi:hypothetical protein [Streptomyces sp. NPDC004728]|uniref:Mu transposase domain-containing protein n=1 Tax=Streptomyces sp. NPDC004728 TaxID=3154289 RepID=UPI0033A62EF6